VKGWGLHGGRGPCSCRVDFGGGAHNSKVCQASLVRKEELERWEAGLDGQDIRGGRHKAISRPSLGLVPENGELPNHVDELRLGDREADAQPGPSGLQPCILLL